jgi:hypothetical protein
VAIHGSLSTDESADRLALRELFDSYAHRATCSTVARRSRLSSPTSINIMRRCTSTGRALSVSTAIERPARATPSPTTCSPTKELA